MNMGNEVSFSLLPVSRGEDNYSMINDSKKAAQSAAPAPVPPVKTVPDSSGMTNPDHPGLAPGSSANTSVANALKGVEFIAQHIKDEDRDNEVSATLMTSS